jgi:hypothetical protein
VRQIASDDGLEEREEIKVLNQAGWRFPRVKTAPIIEAVKNPITVCR